MTDQLVADPAAAVSTPPAAKGGRSTAMPAPPASQPPRPTPAAISLEQDGEPLLGGAAGPEDTGAAPLEAPIAAAWTGAEAAGLICTAVNAEGAVLYIRLGRFDLFGEHWLITDPRAACRGFDEAAARLATKYLPHSAGVAGDMTDVVTLISGLATQLLIPRHVAYARDRQSVREARSQLPDNSPPGAPSSAPAAGDAPLAQSTRFRFKGTDAQVLAAVGTTAPPASDGLADRGIS